MQYIGSLFAQDIRSSELREIVFSRLDLSEMPLNAFTVQVLLITAITMHAEDEMERARTTLDREICGARDRHELAHFCQRGAGSCIGRELEKDVLGIIYY
jgi:hypothetical protein